MKSLEDLEIWFITGSQHLYGAEALTQVAKNSQTIAASLNAETAIPFKVVFKSPCRFGLSMGHPD